MDQFLIPFLLSSAMHFRTVLIVVVCCAVLELIAPYEQQGPWARLRGLFYWLFFIAGMALAYFAIKWPTQYFGLRPLVSLDLATLAQSDDWRMVALGYLALPIPIAIVDFCYYWFQRLQHRVASSGASMPYTTLSRK